jgi:hypothetical protein
MRKLFLIAIIGFSAIPLFAQESIKQEGEFGIGLGGAHYFGDLNTRAKLNRPKLSASIFFRKNFGNYIAARCKCQLCAIGIFGYLLIHRIYHAGSSTLVLIPMYGTCIQGDFNFFVSCQVNQNIVLLLISLWCWCFSYDPFAYLKGEKVFLRPLGYEGQGSSLYPDRQQYSSTAISVHLV